MKITYSRARQLEITIFIYSLARNSRPTYCVKEDSQSRIRRVASSHLVFGKGAIIMPDSHLGNKRDIFHLNNKNNQLER